MCLKQLALHDLKFSYLAVKGFSSNYLAVKFLVAYVT